MNPFRSAFKKALARGAKPSINRAAGQLKASPSARFGSMSPAQGPYNGARPGIGKGGKDKISPPRRRKPRPQGPSLGIRLPNELPNKS